MFGARVFASALAAAMLWASSWHALSAQWLTYPTAGIPRDAQGRPVLTGPAPRTSQGVPDLSGLWSSGQTRLVGTGKGFENGAGRELRSVFFDANWGVKDGLPYQPWAATLAARRKSSDGEGTPETRCLPNSLIQKDGGPGAIHMKKMVQTSGLLIILHERNVEFRQIFLDGRPLPKDPNPSWNGYSVGHWENDTLVVETVGFREDTWLDFFGSPLTEAGRITERFQRPTFGTMVVEITVDDPKAYTKPWTITLDQRLVADTDLLEYVCLENERDSLHLKNVK
jgi:hypothetical protein